MRLSKKIAVLSTLIFLGHFTLFVQAEETGFSDELESVLRKKMSLVQSLAKNPDIVREVIKCNQKSQDIALDAILVMDAEWKKTDGINELIKHFITNACAQLLVAFQDAHDEFPEIFISDAKGLICAETNKTSDYYQADEGWWVRAYNKGRGESYYGEIEYDESSFTEAISIYVPIMDPETGEAIGVIKAVCDITAIMMEL